MNQTNFQLTELHKLCQCETFASVMHAKLMLRPITIEKNLNYWGQKTQVLLNDDPYATDRHFFADRIVNV